MLPVCYLEQTLGWICQVHLGFGLSASAQVPDKPSLALVACPGILHTSYMCDVLFCIISIHGIEN